MRKIKRFFSMSVLYTLTVFMFFLLVLSVFFIFRNSSTLISNKPVFLTLNNNQTAPASDIDTPLPKTRKVKNISNEAEDVEIVMNFMGDCTLGTYKGEFTEYRFNETAERVEPEYFFDGVMSILDEGTFNITNCESVFTDNPLEEVYKDYDPAFWFKTPAKNARIFSAGKINAVGLSNNHIYDYGEQGKLDTIASLEENGILWGDNNKPLLLEHDGIKIVIFFVETWDDAVTSGKINEQIEEYSETTQLQIVFFHSGTEKIHQPDDHKISYAHSFVDSGADLVVGSHPHVLQPMEVYNGVNIIYSLGNFVYGGNTHPENRTIVYTHKFKFDKKKLTFSDFEIHPCYIYTGEMNAFQPTLIDDEYDRQTVLDFMNGCLDSPL